MTTVGLEQQGYEAVGPGSSLCRAKYFMISQTFVRNSNGSHWDSGLENRVLKRYVRVRIPAITYTFQLRTENRDTAPPPLMNEKFRSRIFLKPGRVPLKFLATVRQEISDRKS